MIKRQPFSTTLKEEIIFKEDEIWKRFQKELEVYKELFCNYGLEISAKRYWSNSYLNQMNSSKRLEFVEGYEYFCMYEIKENGRFVVYGDDPIECGDMIDDYKIISIKRDQHFPNLCRKLKMKSRKPLYIEICEWDENFTLELTETIRDELDMIKEGDYCSVFEETQVDALFQYLKNYSYLKFRFFNQIIEIQKYNKTKYRSEYEICIDGNSIQKRLCPTIYVLLNQKIGDYYLGEVVPKLSLIDSRF